MNRTAKIIAVLALPVLLAACNTMEGAGQDIEKGGKNLSESARESK